MFGPAVLVANVVEKGARTRKVYLPAGTTWYDMNDNLRGSAVFVTSEDVKHIESDTLCHLDLLVAAEKDNTFVLYDDDGHTEQYKQTVKGGRSRGR